MDADASDEDDLRSIGPNPDRQPPVAPKSDSGSDTDSDSDIVSQSASAIDRAEYQPSSDEERLNMHGPRYERGARFGHAHYDTWALNDVSGKAHFG